MPAYGKNIKVSGDTQIHMTTTYTRNGVGKKKNILRQFSFVIKGLLISSALVGAVLTTGGAQAFADTSPIAPTIAVTQTVDQTNMYKEQTALISNLKMANKVLKAAINRGEISTSIYENVMKKLQAINSKLEMDGDFNSVDSLVNIVKETDVALKSAIDPKVSNSVLAKRADTLAVLAKTQDLLNISDRAVDEMISQHGMIIETTKYSTTSNTPKKHTAVLASYSNKAKLQNVNVTLNGVKQNFTQSAVNSNGTTLVPMRAIFEQLGAKISWDQKASTVTATKGETVIKLTIGKTTAYINGQAVKLSSKPQLINGNTMVPLRFVSEAMGGTVQWDASSNTVKITNSSVGSVGGNSGGSVQTPSTGSGTSQSGLTVRYGKHDYASQTQAQYNKVMGIIDAAVAKLPNTQFDSGGRLASYYVKYLAGDRASNYSKDSLDFRYLTLVESNIHVLVDNGVGKQTIEELHKAGLIAGGLLEGIKDPGNGTPRSAYDALVSRLTDCDSDAQVYSAVFDSLGYPTAIIASPGHADFIFKVNGSWYNVTSGTFVKVNVSDFLSQSGKYIMSAPTDGSTLR